MTNKALKIFSLVAAGVAVLYVVRRIVNITPPAPNTPQLPNYEWRAVSGGVS